tara:strand:+ start:382 stop:570 length:189 start_codon:yes stop_codon:yes gene_type:complete
MRLGLDFCCFLCYNTRMITIKNTKSETRITQTINGITRSHAVIHDLDLYEKELIARIKKLKK